MTEGTCPLCNTEAKISDQDNLLEINCGICGIYKITKEAFQDIPSEQKLQCDLFKVSIYTRCRSLRDSQIITLFISDDDSDIVPRATISKLISEFPTTLSERVDKALLNLATMTRFTGDEIRIESKDWPVFMPDSIAKTSQYFIMEFLIDEQLIKGEVSYPTKLMITAKGWKKIYELQKNTSTNSNQAFVAMWFSEEMKNIYDSGINKAIKDANYDPVRIDEPHHNGKIDDLIISEIRKSKFVVCDFTGHRGGVYFEAGFAMGLGLPVIWCCKEDHLKDIHFDTRQYNHIVWKEVDDLYNQLYNRIKATIV